MVAVARETSTSTAMTMKAAMGRVLDTPLIDGQGERSAYIYGGGMPIPGPDGRFHLLWVWRETPDHATNNSLSYARTIGR
jgi:hypothetical protein